MGRLEGVFHPLIHTNQVLSVMFHAWADVKNVAIGQNNPLYVEFFQNEFAGIAAFRHPEYPFQGIHTMWFEAYLNTINQGWAWNLVQELRHFRG